MKKKTTSVGYYIPWQTGYSWFQKLCSVSGVGCVHRNLDIDVHSYHCATCNAELRGTLHSIGYYKCLSISTMSLRICLFLEETRKYKEVSWKLSAHCDFDRLLCNRVDDSLSLPNSLPNEFSFRTGHRFYGGRGDYNSRKDCILFIGSVPEGFIPLIVLFNLYMLSFGQAWVSMWQRANCLQVFTPSNHISGVISLTSSSSLFEGGLISDESFVGVKSNNCSWLSIQVIFSGHRLDWWNQRPNSRSWILRKLWWAAMVKSNCGRLLYHY